jgi:hypothetical protein
MLATWLARSERCALLSMFVGGNGAWGRFLIEASVSSTSEASPRDNHRSQETIGLERILSNTQGNEEPTPWPINQMLPVTCNRSIGSF